MSNSFSYASTGQTLNRKATKVLQSMMAPLPAFSTVEIVPTDQAAALTSQTAIATVAPATASGTSIDYNSGDCTVSNVQAAHVQYAQNFGLSNADLQSGARLEWLAEINAIKLSETLWDVVAGLFTTANFGTAAVSVTSANFALGDFEALTGALASKRRSVVLDTAYWAKVKPTWLPVGFNSVYEANRWSTAGTKVHGFVATPNAIVVRSSIAMMPAANVIDRQLMELPDIGIVAETCLWFVPGSRSIRCSFGCYFGCGVADSAALKLLVAP